ncbi:glycosyltransferase family 2 protein [Alkalimarinus coralli]|uniref:glycosyltransferase family 2 protein n=1 Tax=Alkalimarinus coralli TaxID=2935863 RepID=UPI00202B00DF|nr:glycosyltransferase family A protein [Alkalimarinus coralli]
MCELSIIIPTYNAASYIEETLRSIFSQDYHNFEIIIVDDGSKDQTHQMIKAMNDSRIRYVYQTNSGGPARPRNVGIRMARGKYISIFDSDDLMLAGKLSSTVQALINNPGAALALTNYQMITETGEISRDNVLADYHTLQSLPKKSSNQGYHLIDKTDAYRGLVQSNFIATSSVILNKKHLSLNDLFDEQLKNADDKEMWLKLAYDHDIVFVDKILHQYRLRSGSITFRGYEKRVDGIISVIDKQFSRKLEPSLIDLLNQQKALHFYNAGYSCYEQDNRPLARYYFYKSIRLNKSIKTFKMLIATTIPSTLLSIIKRLKTRIQTN